MADGRNATSCVKLQTCHHVDINCTHRSSVSIPAYSGTDRCLIEWPSTSVASARSWQGACRKTRPTGGVSHSASLMVDQVPGLVHGRAVRAVADLVHVAFQRKRQRRACHMRVWADRFRVVDEISGLVHGSAIWQVPDIVQKLLLAISVQGLLIHGCLRRESCSPC